MDSIERCPTTRVSVRKAAWICFAYQLIVLALALALGAIFSPSFSRVLSYWSKMFSAMDARYYLSIAENGYQVGLPEEIAIVFFPAYPLLIGTAAGLLGTLPAALFITHLCSLFGHLVLFLYLREFFGCERRAWRAMLLLFLSPISVYFTAAYSEGMFFLVSAGFLFCLQRRWLLLAACLGFIASMTRSIGCLFIVPYFAHAYSEWRTRRTFAPFLGSLVILLGPAAYLFMNWLLHQDPLYFASIIKSTWYKTPENPILRYFAELSQLPWTLQVIVFEQRLVWIDIFTMLYFPVLIVCYLVRCRISPQRLPPGFLLWTVAQYLVFASQSFWSSSFRYLALMLPAYLMLEHVLSSRWSYVLFLVLSTLVAMNAFYQFARLEVVF